MIDADLVLAKSKSPGVHVENRNLGAPRLGKDCSRYSDWPSPNHGNTARGSCAGALHAMSTDRQELDHCRRVQPQTGRRHDIALWHCKVFARPAVAVDSQHLQVLTAVRLALLAGAARITVEIGFDADDVADLQ